MKSTPKIWFSHGLSSGPWGTKIQMMASCAKALNWQYDSVDYRGIDDPFERVGKLLESVGHDGEPVVLVGSSMGGHVSAAASKDVECSAMFLLAPAFYMPGFEEFTPTPRAQHIEIMHGWSDDIVPVESSIRWAREHQAALHLVNDGHRLEENLNELACLFSAFLNRAGKNA